MPPDRDHPAARERLPGQRSKNPGRLNDWPIIRADSRPAASASSGSAAPARRFAASPASRRPRRALRPRPCDAVIRRLAGSGRKTRCPACGACRGRPRSGQLVRGTAAAPVKPSIPGQRAIASGSGPLRTPLSPRRREHPGDDVPALWPYGPPVGAQTQGTTEVTRRGLPPRAVLHCRRLSWVPWGQNWLIRLGPALAAK